MQNLDEYGKVAQMNHVRNRNDLIKYVEDNPPRGAIGTAIVTGTVELLGGFWRVIPSIHTGWILRITSASKQNVYNVAITHNKYTPDWKVWEVTQVPWDQWMGGDVTAGVNRGDANIFEECSEEHRKAVEHESTIQRIHQTRRPVEYDFQIDWGDEDKSDCV